MATSGEIGLSTPSTASEWENTQGPESACGLEEPRRIRRREKEVGLRHAIAGEMYPGFFLPIHFELNTCRCIFHPTLKGYGVWQGYTQRAGSRLLYDPRNMDAQSLH